MIHPYFVNKNDKANQSLQQDSQAYQQPIQNGNFQQANQRNASQRYHQKSQIIQNSQNQIINNSGNQQPEVQASNQTQIAQRKAKIKFWCLVFFVVALFVAVFLASFLPLHLMDQQQEKTNLDLSYKLPNGYEFTGNKNCSINFTISLGWKSLLDLDLGIIEPGSYDLIDYTNRIGRYGQHKGDKKNGDGTEQYFGPCAFAGEFLIKVRNYNSQGSNDNSSYIEAKFSNGQSFKKELRQFYQNKNQFILVSKLAISQNPSKKYWKSQLI